MNLSDFIAQHRSTAGKPTADIRSRWASRVVARGLHLQDVVGALVRHQGRTETGMLWHARFLKVIGPVGMAA